MNHSETIAALAAALVKAQAAIQPAIKDKKNEAFKSAGRVSKYADLSSVWDACREALTSNGLSVVQMPVDCEGGRVALTTMLLHSSGEYISSTVSTPLTKNDAQGVGSALTYLRRYALSAMVGVVADEDDDGNAASGQSVQQQAQYREASYQPARTPTAPQKPAQSATGATNGKPMSAAEARDRFFAKYGRPAGTTWPMVQAYLNKPNVPEPTTVDGWIAAAEFVKAQMAAAEYDAIEGN